MRILKQVNKPVFYHVACLKPGLIYRQIEGGCGSRYDAIMQTTPVQIHVGELYGKPDLLGHVAILYHVLAVKKHVITLQNMDNPLSQFDTTIHKLQQSGYIRLSQTPYVNLQASGKRKTAMQKLKRCPYTLDIFADRADSERPQLVTL